MFIQWIPKRIRQIKVILRSILQIIITVSLETRPKDNLFTLVAFLGVELAIKTVTK